MSVNILNVPINLTSKLSSGSWTDINLSTLAFIPSTCSGVILSGGTLGINNILNVRKKGSTDNRTAYASLGYCDVWGRELLISGTDANKTFQAYTDNTAESRLYLHGYITDSDALFLTNATSISLSSTGSWETVNVSSTLDNTHSAAIVLVESQTTVAWGYYYDIRGVGDTVDLYADNEQRILQKTYRHLIVGLNSSGQFQFKRENSNVKLYLLGGLKSSVFTATNRAYSENLTNTLGSEVDKILRYSNPCIFHASTVATGSDYGRCSVRPTGTSYNIAYDVGWMHDQKGGSVQALFVPRSSDKSVTYFKNANTSLHYYVGYFNTYTLQDSSVILDLRGNNANGSQTFTDESAYAHSSYTVTGSLTNSTSDHIEGQGCINSPDYSSYLRYTAQPEFALGRNWTIEFYCNLSSDYNNGTIGNLIEAGDETLNTGIGIGARPGSISNYGIWAYYGPGTGWTVLDGFTYNTWHHVAVSSDGVTIRFFKDGIRQTIYTYPTPPNLTQQTINMFYSLLYPAGRIKGKLDYVLVSNVCKYLTDFAPPLPPQTYTYSGAQSLTFTPNAVNRLQYLYRYLGNTVFELTPNAQIVFGHIFRYSGDIDFSFNVAGAYRRIYKVYRYAGNTGFELIPASATELRTDFHYTGNTNVVFLPASQVRHAFNYAYDGELLFSLNEESFYVFGLGYLYNGNINFEFNPDAESSLNYEYVGDLEIAIVPDANYYAILQAYAPMQKLPMQILPNLKKLFRIKAQKILVYPSIVRKNDPYEKTKTRHLLPAISMQALVKDFSPSALVWQNLGLSEIGAKTIVFEKKYIALLKVAGKVEIDGIEYAVYRDAGNQAQIWDKADMGVALIKRV